MKRSGLAIIFKTGARMRPLQARSPGRSILVFLLRCIFWLSIVYSSMSWASDAGQPHALRDVLARESRALAQTAGNTAVDHARAWCVDSPRRCLADASQLTALVSANQSEDLTEAAAPAREIYPLPPANPHRHATPGS